MTIALLAHPPLAVAPPITEHVIQFLASIPAPIYTLLGTIVGLLGGIFTTTIAHKMSRARDNENWAKTKVYENVLVLNGAITQLTMQPPGLLESASQASQKTRNHREWRAVFAKWDVTFAYEALIKIESAMHSLLILDFLGEYQTKNHGDLLESTRHFYKMLIDPLSFFPNDPQPAMQDFINLWNASKDNLQEKRNKFVVSLGGIYWLTKTPAEKRQFEKLTQTWQANEN